MTNLYDFLRRIQNDPRSPLTEDDVAWLDQYLNTPEHQLHFKSRQVGYDSKKEEPIMALDLAIAGEGLEIFAMLCEAMVQNFQFAEIVMKAASFYRDHIPSCPECSKKHFGPVNPVKSWEFKPHKPQT